jgi:virulence factor Mce-like protein
VRRSGRTTSPERPKLDRLRLELKRASRPFLLYVLLVIAGLLTAGDIVRNLAGDKPWVDYTAYRVAFTDVKGVVPSRAELRLAGVKAGSITEAALVHGQAVLTLNLESRYAPLYRDAKVRIRPVTPLEDMYVDVESRGHPAAGKLAPGEILPAQRTVSPVEIGTVLDVLDKGSRANLATLLDELGRGLKDRGRDLRWAFARLGPFLGSARRMTEALSERRQNLAGFVHDFGGITTKLAEHDRTLATFVTSANATLAQLATDDAPFRGTIAALPPTLSVMKRSFASLRQTEDALDPALRALQPVAGSLPNGLNALTRLSRDAAPALVALRPAARGLRPLAQDLRPTASDLAAAFGLLTREAPQIDEATKKTVPCLVPASELLGRAMSFTKFGDAPNNVGDARADVRVSFNSGGGGTKDPSWTIHTPCNVKGGTP